MALSRSLATKDGDERQIRSVLTDLTTAIRDKDAAGLIATLADDAVTFDLAPPLPLDAKASHDPAPLEQWFATWEGPIRSEPRDLTIDAGADVAYAYALQHMTGTKKGGEKVDLWFRATACFRRACTGSRW